MATSCSDSATGTQLTGVCITSRNELDNDSISIISLFSGLSSASTSKEAPGSSNTETMDSTSNNSSSSLLTALQQAKSSNLCRKESFATTFRQRKKQKYLPNMEDTG